MDLNRFKDQFSNDEAINESLDSAVDFTITDDTKMPTQIYCTYVFDGVDYGMSLEETNFARVYELKFYRIVNDKRRFWSFMKSTHIRPGLATMLKFAEASIPFIKERMDGIVIPIPGKYASEKFNNLAELMIKRTYMNTFRSVRVVSNDKKQSYNQLFVIRKTRSPKTLFASKAFSKYAFDGIEPGTMPAESVADIKPKKIQPVTVSKTPSTKYTFGTFEVIDQPEITKGIPPDHLEVIKNLKKPIVKHKLTPLDASKPDNSLKPVPVQTPEADDAPSMMAPKAKVDHDDIDYSTFPTQYALVNPYAIGVMINDLLPGVKEIVGNTNNAPPSSSQIVKQARTSPDGVLHALFTINGWLDGIWPNNLGTVKINNALKALSVMLDGVADGTHANIWASDRKLAEKAMKGISSWLGTSLPSVDTSTSTSKTFGFPEKHNITDPTELANAFAINIGEDPYKFIKPDGPLDLKIVEKDIMDVVQNDKSDVLLALFQHNGWIFADEFTAKGKDKLNSMLDEIYNISQSPDGFHSSKLMASYSKVKKKLTGIAQWLLNGQIPLSNIKPAVKAPVAKVGPTVPNMKVSVTQLAAMLMLRLPSMISSIHDKGFVESKFKSGDFTYAIKNLESSGALSLLYTHNDWLNSSYNDLNSSGTKITKEALQMIAKGKTDKSWEYGTDNYKILMDTMKRLVKIENYIKDTKDFAAANSPPPIPKAKKQLPSITDNNGQVVYLNAPTESYVSPDVDFTKLVSTIPGSGMYTYTEYQPEGTEINESLGQKKLFIQQEMGYSNLSKAGLNAVQLTNLKSYTGSASGYFNSPLRRRLAELLIPGSKPADYDPNDDKYLNNKIPVLSKAFDNIKPLSHSLWVYRGAQLAYGMTAESLMPGNTYIDPAFMSTSIKSMNSFGVKNLKLRIYLPEGSRVLPVLDNSMHGNEMEIVLPAMSILKIVRTDIRDSGPSAVYYLTCVFTGRIDYNAVSDVLMNKGKTTMSEAKKVIEPPYDPNEKFGGEYNPQVSKKLAELIKTGKLPVKK